MIALIAPLVLTASSSDMRQLPASTIHEPLSATCMLSLALNDKEREQLKQEIHRDAVTRKARALSRLIAGQMSLMDENLELYPVVLEEKRDLHSHGLISDQEYQTFINESPEVLLNDIASELRKYPDCKFLEGYPDTEGKRYVLTKMAELVVK